MGVFRVSLKISWRALTSGGVLMASVPPVASLSPPRKGMTHSAANGVISFSSLAVASSLSFSGEALSCLDSRPNTSIGDT